MRVRGSQALSFLLPSCDDTNSVSKIGLPYNNQRFALELRLQRYVYCTLHLLISDVVLGICSWSLVVLKDQISVLGPVLGLEA